VKESGRIARTGAVCLILLMGMMLAWHPAADAPIHISENPGVHFDPPSKCHNARNRILFGRWVTDEWTPYIHSPLYTLLQAALLRLLGVGLAQLRVLSILCSVLTLAMLWHLLRREQGSATALIALVLCGFSLVFLVYGRSGLLEPLEIATIFLTAGLVSYSVTRHHQGYAARGHLGAALASVTAWLALLSKPLAAPVLLAVPLAFLISLRGRARRQVLILTLSIVAIIGLMYLFFFFLPHRDLFRREWGHVVEHAGRHGRLSPDAWYHQPILVSMPRAKPLMAAGILGLAAVLAPGRRAARGAGGGVLFLGLTFLLISQILAFSYYRPERYYYPLLPLAAVLAASGWHRLQQSLEEPDARARLVSPAIMLYWAAATYLIFLGLHPSWHTWHVPWLGALSASAALAVAAVSFTAVLFARCRTAPAPVRRALGRALTVAGTIALVAYCAHNLGSWWKWHHHAHYSMYGFSRCLGTRLHQAVIAGESPLFAVIENRHRALKVTRYHMNWGPFRQAGATHVITKVHDSYYSFYRRIAHRWFRNAVLLDNPVVAGIPFRLYALGLRPLRVQYEIRPDQQVVLTISNPDTHTDRVLDCLAVHEAAQAPVFASATTVVVRTRATRSVTFPLAADAQGSRLRIWILKPMTWTQAECHKCRAEGLQRIWEDARAAGNLARTFVRPGKKPVSPRKGRILLVRRLPPEGLLLCGARMRGVPGRGDQYLLSVTTDKTRAIIQRIAPDRIAPDRYTPFVYAVRIHGGKARVEVSFEGTGMLFVDGLLAATAAELDRLAEWQADIRL